MQKVEWFNEGKNYCFIAYKDNENEYVEFELVNTEKGYGKI